MKLRYQCWYLPVDVISPLFFVLCLIFICFLPGESNKKLMGLSIGNFAIIYMVGFVMYEILTRRVISLIFLIVYILSSIPLFYYGVKYGFWNGEHYWMGFYSQILNDEKATHEYRVLYRSNWDDVCKAWLLREPKSDDFEISYNKNKNLLEIGKILDIPKNVRISIKSHASDYLSVIACEP